MNAEQAMLTGEMARPGFQLIMLRLQEHAIKLGKEYDNINFVAHPEQAMRIQITRDIILNGMPRVIEQAMNAGKPEVQPRWTFKEWFKSIFGSRLETGGKRVDK